MRTARLAAACLLTAALVTTVAAVPARSTAAPAAAAPAAAAPAAAAPAAAAPAVHVRLLAARAFPARVSAMRWARHRRGCWYAWGGTSCQHGFDCSGLVQTAYRHAGVTLPRTTSGMLASSKLVRVARPKMGDLAFYGSGHVELVTRHWRRSTYGAQQSGTRVGWHRYGGSWQPSGFYRVRGGG